MKNTSSRFLALLTVGALSATALLHPTPAHADKAKNYKYGAIALGVVGGYLLSKGKTVEGAAALGAGAYTYKKGEDARKAEKYDRYGRYDYNGPRDRNDYGNGYGDRYPNGRYDSRYDGRDSNGNYRARNDDRFRDRDDHDNRYRDDRDRDNRYRDDHYRDDVRVR